MATNKRSKYDIVECTIIGHAPYGLIIEASPGERGYIDSGDIADMLLEARDWPRIGQEITGVVISYSHDGRLVVSARPSDIALVRSATDIKVAMDAWVRLCRADEEYVKAKDSLIASDDMEAVLRWALSRSKISLEPGVALRALANAPSGLLLDLMDEVVRLIAVDNHRDEASRAIAAAGSHASVLALSRAVDSLLAESRLNVQEFSRLVEVLRPLGAERSLDKVIEAMLSSDDPNVRKAGMLFRGQRG